MLLWNMCQFLCAVLCLVAQLCPALYDPKDCSLTGSSAMGILQARILEWAAMVSSRRFSQPRDQTQVSCIAGRFFTIWALGKPQHYILLQVQMPKYRSVLSLNVCYPVELSMTMALFYICAVQDSSHQLHVSIWNVASVTKEQNL